MVKQKSRNKVLGLAVGERSALAAEVSAGDGRPELLRVGEFVYPAGVTLLQPDALGKALGQFLKEQQFTARSAVFGIPARWVVSKPKDVPPADAVAVAELLRIQAESEFSSELKDLVYDYAGDPSAAGARTVLLLAVPGRHVEQVKAIALAARLTPVALTPSTTALGAASARSGNKDAKNSMVLSVGPSGTELSAQTGGMPRALRHIGAATTAGPMLLGELRRAVALMPKPGGANGAPGLGNGSANGTNGANGAAGPRRGLVLWDGVGLDAAARQAIGEATGAAVEDGDLKSLGVAAPSVAVVTGGTRSFAPAVSLALAGLRDEPLAVDFLHSKLAAPQRKGIDPRVLWPSIAGGVVLLLAIVMLADYLRQEGAISRIDTDLKTRAPVLAAAKTEVDKIGYAERWHQDPDKQRFVACLNDLTLKDIGIPEDGQTYLTNFTLHDNLKGLIAGKTTSGNAPFAIRSQMNAKGRFADLVLSTDERQGAKGGREVSFTITFTYVPGAAGASSSSATKPAAGDAAAQQNAGRDRSSRSSNSQQRGRGR